MLAFRLASLLHVYYDVNIRTREPPREVAASGGKDRERTSDMTDKLDLDAMRERHPFIATASHDKQDQQ